MSLPKKQVIQLGLLSDTSVLPSGRKDVYYMYYKADKDLYMYDSYKNKEYNLFRLQYQRKGSLIITATEAIKGFLSIFASKSKASRLVITATRTPLISDGGVLKVVIKSLFDTKGILVVNASGDVARGTLRVSVRDTLGNKGILSITSTHSEGLGNLQVQLLDGDVPQGNLVITANSNLAYGNPQVSLREIDVVENGSLIITATHDYNRGDLQVTVKQL